MFRIIINCVVVVLTLALCGGVGAQPAADSSSSELAHPTVNSDGRVTAGSKSLWQKNGWAHVMMVLDNDAISSFYESFVFDSGYISPVFFIDNATRFEGKHTIFEAGMKSAVESDESLGTYRMTTTLREDGLIEVHGTTEFVSEAAKQELKNRHADFHFPKYLELKGEYVRGSQSRPLDVSSHERFEGNDLKKAEFHFFPGEPKRSFKLIPIAVKSIQVQEHKIAMMPTDGGEMHFLLDIREPASLAGDGSNVSPNGVDFVALDDLHLPDYSVSRNMLRNPSFEAGFRYWGIPTYVHNMIPLSYTDMFTIDESEAHSGERSMRVRAIGPHNPLNVGTMGLPLAVDEPHTVSFYAKASVAKGANVHLWGRSFYNQLFDSTLNFPATDEWKRYEATFTPTERIGAVFFFARHPGTTDDEAVVWIDDVQIERAPKATEFTQPPLVTALTSAERGNFLEFGQEPELKLEVMGEPGAKGTAKLSVEDFFFKTMYETSLPVELDDDGKATVELDELSDKLRSDGLRGVWVARVQFEMEGEDEPFTDYYRFSVMDMLKNEHKHKNLFNVMWAYHVQMGGPEIERFLERKRAIGFGSYTYDFIHFAMDAPLDLDRERAEVTAKYGLESMGRPIVGIHHGENGGISEGGDAAKMWDIRDRLNPSDDELAEFEAIAELKARNRPWNDIWWFTGESNPAMMPLVADRDSFAKWLLATHRGIKRGNPDAKVLITGGPWNLAPDSGTKWNEEYIQDTKRIDPSVTFDGAAGHHYRNLPENPDLDRDIEAFIEMLDRNGHSDWPIYINEGGHYHPFNLPQEGISPYIAHSANGWYVGPLSYDVGKAERIGAAFTARNWLIGLKYGDRVECMNDFNNPARYTDFDFTSRPYEKVPNTLGRLLGNSTFHRDIRFAPMVRCYVFEDDPTGDPIAALWGHDEAVDRWKKDAPIYQFDFTGLDVTAIDLMENRVELARTEDGRTLIPATPFPIFLRAQPGQIGKLSEALAAGTPAAGGGSLLEIAAYPNAEGGSTVTARNGIDRDTRLDGELTINGQSHDVTFEVGPRSEEVQQLSLSAAARPGEVGRFEWSLRVDGQPAGGNAGPYMLFADEAKPQGSIDWESLPANPVGTKGTLRAAVRGERLHLYLEAPSGTNEGRATDAFVGVGLYVDPFMKSGDLGEVTTVKSDLAVYELVTTDPGKLGAMCRYVQGTQAGSGTDFLVPNRVQPDIRVLDRSRDGRPAVEVVIPQAVLSPLQLETGATFGLNVSFDSTASLLPLPGFQSVTDPGDIELVMGVVGR